MSKLGFFQITLCFFSMLCLILLFTKVLFTQVNAAAEVIYDLVDPSANLIFGAVIDPSISGQVSC